MIKIAVCLPGRSFDRPWLEAWNALYAYLLQQKDRFTIELFYAESNNIYLVRNTVANMILDSGSRPDYVLWIDSDNIVSALGFEELLASAEAGELDAVGAWYRFNGAEGPIIAAGTGNRYRPTEEDLLNATGLIEVGYIGFGFLLMRMSMLEGLGKDPFKPMFNGKFATDDGGFCDNAVANGYKFYLHPRVFSHHLKLGTVGSNPAIRV